MYIHHRCCHRKQSFSHGSSRDGHHIKLVPFLIDMGNNHSKLLSSEKQYYSTAAEHTVT